MQKAKFEKNEISTAIKTMALAIAMDASSTPSIQELRAGILPPELREYYNYIHVKQGGFTVGLATRENLGKFLANLGYNGTGNYGFYPTLRREIWVMGYNVVEKGVENSYEAFTFSTREELDEIAKSYAEDPKLRVWWKHFKGIRQEDELFGWVTI